MFEMVLVEPILFFFSAPLLKIRIGSVFLESNLDLFIKSFKLFILGESITLLL